MIISKEELCNICKAITIKCICSINQLKFDIIAQGPVNTINLGTSFFSLICSVTNGSVHEGTVCLKETVSVL